MNMVESGVNHLNPKADAKPVERGPVPGSVRPTHASQPADSIKPKIEVKNLNFFYNKYHALKNINLRIPEKKVTAFIGPSGCGKSTLLRCFNRLNDLLDHAHITAGAIKIEG